MTALRLAVLLWIAAAVALAAALLPFRLARLLWIAAGGAFAALLLLLLLR